MVNALWLWIQMPPFMNASARDYNEAFFLDSTYQRSYEFIARNGIADYETRRIYLCLHKYRVSWQLCLFFSPLIAGVHHIFQGFFFFPLGWFCLLWGLACQPHLVVFSKYTDIHTFSGRQVGHHSLDSKRDNVLLQPWHGLPVSNMLLYCGYTSIPDNLADSKARESG